MWSLMWFLQISYARTYQWRGVSQRYDFNQFGFSFSYRIYVHVHIVDGPSWSYSFVFTTACAISAYHHRICEFDPRSWRGILDTTICDKVCQWLTTGRWCLRVLWLHPSINWPSRYSWNIVESGVKHHKPKSKPEIWKLYNNSKLQIDQKVSHSKLGM